MKFLFTRVHNTGILQLQRQNELGGAKCLLSTSIASSAITAVKRLLEEINPKHS